ncbi:MAG: hypothetical protein RBT80_05825 [Candidatus Vecturithrix sp.]|jgi:hypothetical protein|nr:hypothetical protein [Candidatus Vecturithrix sp.]
MGKGFYKAFLTNQYILPAPYPAGVYPILADSHFENGLYRKDEEAFDRLSKGIAAYKSPNSDALYNESWPEILRQYPKKGEINTVIERAINYPLYIRSHAELPVNRTWTWEVQVITTGTDGKCQTPFEGNDKQIINVSNTGEPHAVAIIGGEPGEADETLDTRIKACFTEAEYAEFLSSHRLEEETVEPLIARNTDQICFDVGEISEEESSILGDSAIQQLQEKNDDLIEWVTVTYGEEAWLRGDSWREELVNTKGGN